MVLGGFPLEIEGTVQSRATSTCTSCHCTAYISIYIAVKTVGNLSLYTVNIFFKKNASSCDWIIGGPTDIARATIDSHMLHGTLEQPSKSHAAHKKTALLRTLYRQYISLPRNKSISFKTDHIASIVQQDVRRARHHYSTEVLNTSPCLFS